MTPNNEAKVYLFHTPNLLEINICHVQFYYSLIKTARKLLYLNYLCSDKLLLTHTRLHGYTIFYSVADFFFQYIYVILWDLYIVELYATYCNSTCYTQQFQMENEIALKCGIEREHVIPKTKYKANQNFSAMLHLAAVYLWYEPAQCIEYK